MKIRIGVVLSLMVVCLAFSSLMFAADDAYLYIVHGLPGRDVSASLDPALPVDILLNNDLCIERGTTFGLVVGPLALPSGQYNLKMGPANPFVPCSESPIVDTDVSLKAGQDVTAIAALDEKGQPTVLNFVNDLASVAEGQARVTLTNAGDAPVLQVTLQVVNSKQKYTYNVNPGKAVDATLPANEYTIEVAAKDSLLIPPQPILLTSVSATLVYAVGRADNGSLALVTKTIRGVL